MKASPENMVLEHFRELDPGDPSQLILDLADFAVFSEEAATVVVAPKGEHFSTVVWNLEPGQENDYHRHPSTEHLQFVIEGECEYSLGDGDPVRVRPGQVVVIPAGVPHGIRNVSRERARYVSFNSPGPYEKVLVERPRR